MYNENNCYLQNFEIGKNLNSIRIFSLVDKNFKCNQANMLSNASQVIQVERVNYRKTDRAIHGKKEKQLLDDSEMV
ncbi:hypothetical protein T05_15625 [Trichinella murrelli]|uniref:Uncharacterized protein n=1 Tax=Trichinella murrelli TaxID=144512 RepID=A0A0V0TII1_9BILA|nr:hypothetical protein T05_15625 [Trichinella murrelli]